MKRALPLLALLGGCALRDARVSASSCASSNQCSRSDVCFLGECRAPASNLSVVRVEVRPPSGTEYGVRSLQLDVSRSVLNDFSVNPTLNIGDPATPGTVTQAQDGASPAPVANAIVTFSDHTPVIPDRVEQIVAPTDSTGAYRARIPQGSWDVLVQPPAPLPPMRFGVLDTSAPAATFVIPSSSSLPQLDGGITFDGGLPLAGAGVTAVDGSGAPLSSAAASQADGNYTLYLAPDAGAPSLQIGPFVSSDGGVAGSAALDPFPTYAAVPYAPTVDVSLPPLVILSGRVLDSGNLPVPGARVYARSTSSSWTLARSASADATASYSLVLRAGDYLVQAAPGLDPTVPGLSVVQSVPVHDASVVVDLICPPKLHRSGVVVGPDGNRVSSNFQVMFTRLAEPLVGGRILITTTDPTGYYNVSLDAGRWRVEVIPPADAPLPRTVVQLDVGAGGDPTFNIQIPSPLKLGGTVKGTVGGLSVAPIAGAQVSFFALDASGRSVFLGSGATDSYGRYSVILPDVGQTAFGP